MKDRTGRSKDEKKKQDSQRGKSTNERADLATAASEIQRKAEEDNPENKRRALDAALGQRKRRRWRRRNEGHQAWAG